MQSKSKQEPKTPTDPHKSTPKQAQSATPKAPAALPQKLDAVPMPEHGAHSHSYAAHLGGPARAYTVPANIRQSSFNQLREPPQQMGRIGKQHRG
jgi:hypothetical protein